MNKPKSPLGANLKHESAHLHVSGEARYVDDFHSCQAFCMHKSFRHPWLVEL